MGWTTCFRAANYKTIRQNGRLVEVVDRQKECDALCTWSRKEEVGSDGKTYPAIKNTVLKSAMVGSVYYAAVKREVDGRKPIVWAAVFLTCGKSRYDGTIWGYKDMDETMCPYYYDCPATILALLTPTDDESANKWRENCRKTIAEKAEKRKCGKEEIFVPMGIAVDARRGSWILTSANFRAHSCYSAIRFTRVKWHTFNTVMRVFLEKYGTEDQRAEYAASGRECPTAWKKSAA